MQNKLRNQMDAALQWMKDYYLSNVVKLSNAYLHDPSPSFITTTKTKTIWEAKIDPYC